MKNLREVAALAAAMKKADELSLSIGALRRTSGRGIGARTPFPNSRVTDRPRDACRDLSPRPQQICEIENNCDCTLVSFSTLAGATLTGTAPVASGGTISITVSGQDADVKPMAIWFTAFVAGEAGASTDTIASPVIEVPVMLTNAVIGQQGQIRNGGSLANGLNSAGFAATREPVCIDWDIFRPTSGQELVLTFVNFVDTVAIHVVGFILGTVADCG